MKLPQAAPSNAVMDAAAFITTERKDPKEQVFPEKGYIRKGVSPPVEGLESSDFIGYSENAIDEKRNVQVLLGGNGRHSVWHSRDGKDTFQPGRVFTRESDGARIAFINLSETSEGYEQIAADFRDAFLAMGCDEVRLKSEVRGEDYVSYRPL